MLGSKLSLRSDIPMGSSIFCSAPVTLTRTSMPLWLVWTVSLSVNMVRLAREVLEPTMPWHPSVLPQSVWFWSGAPPGMPRTGTSTAPRATMARRTASPARALPYRIIQPPPFLLSP